MVLELVADDMELAEDIELPEDMESAANTAPENMRLAAPAPARIKLRMVMDISLE